MKHLKLFFALFAMLALGVGNAWATEATLSSITTKNVVTTNGGSVSTTFDDVTCTVTRNSSNQPGFYTSKGIVRYYKDDVMTLSVPSGNAITKVVFTMYDSSVPGTANPTGLSSNTWSGNSGSISFTGGGTVKISKIVVTYEASGSTTPKQKYTLTYQAGSVTGSLEVEEGANLLDALKDITPVACDPTSTEPIGWSESEITTKQADAPTLLTDADVMPSKEHSVYYVFAKKETTGGGVATEKTGEYTFANYTAGTQYAKNEEHKLDDDVTIYTNDCHFTTQLRIYSSATNNGYVVSNELPGKIVSMSFNLGYKEDKLNIYGSTDGSTWNNVGSIETTTSYADKSIDFGETNYTYFKLDVEGTQQVRITTMDITYMSSGGTTTISDYTTSCDATPDVIVKTLKSIAVSGMTTEYVEGAEFTFDGTCTATYSVTKNDVAQDDETKTVTPTVSAPNMTQIGEQTVTVSYTDGEVTAETSYTINITEKPKYTITWNNAGTETTTTVKQGEAFGTLQKPADCPSGKKFMGWTAATSVNNDGSGIVYVKETDIPTSDMTYYAVFAVEKVGEGEVGSADVTLADGNFADSKITWDSDYATIVQEKVSGSTAVNSSHVASPRWYVGHKVTITPKTTINITAITIDQGTGDYAKFDQATATNASIAIDGQTVTITPLNGTEAVVLSFGKQVRPISINIAKGPATTYSDYSLNCDISVEPTWTISKDEIDFGAKYVGFEYTETFTINASNLTDDIALEIDGSNFTVLPTSIATDAEFPQTVTVTYAPTAVGSHNATLNITSGSTLSKSIALTGSATEATIYTLTALADINPTDKVIIVGTSGGNTYAMSNDKGANDAPDAIAVTVIDNKIATDKTNILWNIAKDGDNLTIYPADQTAKWLYCLANENDGVRVGTGAAKEFTIDKGYLYTTQTTNARHIGIYNNSDWRCYKPSGDAVASNITGQSFAFYVLPNTDPSISVTPASKDFGVLTVGETVTQEIEITALNITQALTAEITGDGFTKSEIVDNKITITFAPTEVKEYSATLTISAGTEASASVTLAGEGVAAAYSVTYNKNGAEGNAPTDEAKYVAGSQVTVAGQDDMTMAGYRFAGWKYGDEIYKAGAKFTMPAEDVTFMAQWVEKEDFSTGYWVLVNDASELAADDYVVIAAAEYDVAMKSYETGNNCKQVEVAKANNLLTWNENVGVFQLTKNSEKYTFRDVNTEQYLYAAGGTNNNYLKASSFPTSGEFDKYYWTIDIAEGIATIKANVTEEGARNTIRYNANAGTGGQLFSCYASGQKDIALYKYVTELPTPTPDYTRTVTAGNYGTICLPNGSSNYTGATFFEIAYRDANGVYLDEVKTLVAGVPYIFQATSTEIAVIYEGEAAAAGSANGLYGTFTEISDVAAEHADKDEYILTGGVIRFCEANCTVPANRAYIVLEEVSTEQKPVQEGRRRISMTVQGENEATGLDNITTTDAPVKVLVNGQLIIIREGVKYNVQGVRL